MDFSRLAALRPGYTVITSHQILGIFMLCKKKKEKKQKAALETNALISDG